MEEKEKNIKELAYIAQVYHQYHINISSRTIYVEYGQLDNTDTDTNEKNLSGAAEAIKNLELLSFLDPVSPINIILNTRGGDERDGLAIYDYIRSLSNPVDIYVYGTCYSMGAWILQAARVRYISQLSTLMVHSGTWAPDASNYESAFEWADFTKKFEPKIYNVLLARIKEKQPKFTLGQLKAFLERDRPFSAREAVAFGLADKIIPPARQKDNEEEANIPHESEQQKPKEEAPVNAATR